MHVTNDLQSRNTGKEERCYSVGHMVYNRLGAGCVCVCVVFAATAASYSMFCFESHNIYLRMLYSKYMNY